jgi:hypothetical protein
MNSYTESQFCFELRILRVALADHDDLHKFWAADLHAAKRTYLGLDLQVQHMLSTPQMRCRPHCNRTLCSVHAKHIIKSNLQQSENPSQARYARIERNCECTKPICAGKGIVQGSDVTCTLLGSLSIVKFELEMRLRYDGSQSECNGWMEHRIWILNCEKQHKGALLISRGEWIVPHSIYYSGNIDESGSWCTQGFKYLKLILKILWCASAKHHQTLTTFTVPRHIT